MIDWIKDSWQLILIVLVLCVVVILSVLWAVEIWHWILTVTGDQTAGTRWNLAWSGFLSAGVLSTGIYITFWHRLREKNCHVKWCWRIRHRPNPDGHWLCKHCQKKPASKLKFHEIHPDHQ